MQQSACLFTSSLDVPQGPDYRLYKSEPELTTVAEVDESNGEEKTEPVSESESSAKGLSPGTAFATFQLPHKECRAPLPHGLCLCSLSISQFDSTASTIK